MNRRNFLRKAITLVAGATAAPLLPAGQPVQRTAMSIYLENSPTIGQVMRTATSCQSDFVHLKSIAALIADSKHFNTQAMQSMILQTAGVKEAIISEVFDGPV